MEVDEMTHTVLTFVTKVKPDQAASLGKLLDQMGTNPETNSYIPFRSLKRLHFGSLVLHQSPDYGPYLVFENNFDGVLEDYLADLYTQAANGLHQIYSCCLDYSVTSATDRQGMLNYLTAHVVRPNAYHVGNTGRTAERILQERELRTALEQQADSLVRSGKATAAQSVLTTLQQFVRSEPRFSWVMSPAGPRETFAQKFVAWAKLIFVVALLVGLVVGAFFSVLCRDVFYLLAALLVLGLLVLRYKESTDSVQADAADSDKVTSLLETENHTASVQNHMASITIVKPGWLRRSTLWLVLWAVNLLARARATDGELSGIPSIHFAHWSMIDNGRRLLFLSNFDGSWENYLDDFIDKASDGLTGVWSNTVNFPRTYFLIFGGATDGPRFKAVARDSQTVTNVWYSAYRELTVQGIDNSSSVREDLLNPADAAAAQALLQRL
jgi:hypothetical protein